jgi:hypothetical protein
MRSPFLPAIALFGIPAAGSVVLLLLVQIPRFIYGQSIPLLLGAGNLKPNFTFKPTTR